MHMSKYTLDTHNDGIVNELINNPNLIYDKKWRMTNIYWILTKKGTKIPFKLNKAQEHFFDNYINVPNPIHRNIILKSRQLGFTTFIDIHILDEVMFNPNREGLIVAHKIKDAKEIFDRKIDFAMRNMANDIKTAYFQVKRNSAEKIQFVIDYGVNKGSTSGLTVAGSGRGGTYHYFHMSELAKMCILYPSNAQEIITGTIPAIPSDGFIYIESTAEGMNGPFFEMYQEALKNKSKNNSTLSKAMFYPHFYNWTWDVDDIDNVVNETIATSDMEEGDIDWGEYKIEHNLSDKEITYYYLKWLGMQRDTKKLNQEYPTTSDEAFIASGSMYFPTSRVMSLFNNAENGIKGEIDSGGTFNKFYEGELEIFKQPEKGKNYILGGDTSEGLSHGDAQVAYVIESETRDCVAIWRSKTSIENVPAELFTIGKYYNWALMAVESNKDGLWVNTELERMGYQNLFYRRTYDDITMKETKMYGWKTTQTTRPLVLASLKADIASKDSGFPKVILDEMLHFVRNKRGKAEALSGKHDDVIMAGAIAVHIARDKSRYNVNTDSNGNELPTMSEIMFGEKHFNYLTY